MISAPIRTHARYSTLTLITLVAVIINTLGYAAELQWLGFDREVSIIAGLLALASALVATGWRWTPILAALLAGGILFGNPFLARNLALPVTSGFFLAAATQLASGIVVVIAGLAAAIQNYRRN